MPTAEPDPALTALGREAERAARRVEQLETLVQQLAADFTTYTTATHPGAGDPGPGDATGARAWLLITDPGTARATLADLTVWLGRVYLRYPGAVLPSCWLWHPGVIEELWWLRQAHTDAYSTREGSPAKAGDWHDRQRPGVTRRIAAATGGCELTLHDPPHPPPAVPLTGSADRVADTWSTTQTTPQPAPEELTQAQQHDHTKHRTSHR